MSTQNGIEKNLSRVTPSACVLLTQWGNESRKTANTGKVALFDSCKLPVTLLSLQSDMYIIYLL